MNLKRIFGAILTILGISGLLYAAYLFMNTQGSDQDVRGMIIYSVLGILFFSSGIGLVQATKDGS
ncbi:hypothetical protein NAT51_07985 [Flavobacterium amniphilum]|uniref:hypothetical protein n=1 Tax=Flavobacterium amniphilum TaxID=1834035 RepID=UPI00202A115C|nr:hypothetical protein [Flavobacterium amniphilum]MCL9805457.1 hypothetical protein [Flavobacterium amniphilum]